MNTYAVVADGVVFNVVVWDGVAPWSPGVGAVALQLVAGEWCEIGAVYDANASPRFALAI